MRTDITLESTYLNRKIIIDTKYYTNLLVENQGRHKFHSSNLYQMFAYLNNVNYDGNVSGILLYPKPYKGEEIDERYRLNINSKGALKNSQIRLVTIDLSKDWWEIHKELISLFYI